MKKIKTERNSNKKAVFIIILSTFLSFTAFARTVNFTAPTGTVEQYQMLQYKFDVTSPTKTNGFTGVVITGTFTPQGKSPIIVKGFCDSDNGTLFYLRFTPEQLGNYSYSINFNDGATETYTGTFTVLAGSRKGFARPDLMNGGTKNHKFTFSNGDFFIPSSQTAWMLLDCTDAQWKAYVDRTQARHQNILRFVLEGDLFNGSKIDALNCWPMGGTRSSPNFDSFNLTFWRKAESIIQYAYERGILSEVVLAEEYQSYSTPWTTLHKYMDYLTARLSPMTAVFMYETFNESSDNKAAQKEMGDYLDLNDKYKHPVAPSPGTTATPLWASESWVDVSIYHSCTGDDQLSTRYYKWANDALSYNKPVWCDEMGREIRHGNDDPQHRRKQLWTLNIAGGHWNYHSGEGCEEIQLMSYVGPGAQYIQYVNPFWMTTDWYNLAPENSAITLAPASQFNWAMRSPTEVVAYMVNETAGVSTAAGTMAIKAPCAGTIIVEFYNPKDGTYYTASKHTLSASAKDAVLTFNYPAFTDDLVLRAYLQPGVPVVSINTTATTIHTGSSATFNIVSSDPDGSIVSYQWNWGGTTQNGTGNPPASLDKTFSVAGNYAITLSVTDNANPANTTTSNIVNISVVDNFPPIITKVMYEVQGSLDINTSPDRNSITINTGKTLDFHAIATDTENDALSYAWDLDGNGTYETTGQSPSKTFSAAGTINAGLKVSDANGFATKTFSITVSNSLTGWTDTYSDGVVSPLYVKEKTSPSYYAMTEQNGAMDIAVTKNVSTVGYTAIVLKDITGNTIWNMAENPYISVKVKANKDFLFQIGPAAVGQAGNPNKEPNADKPAQPSNIIGDGTWRTYYFDFTAEFTNTATDAVNIERFYLNFDPGYQVQLTANVSFDDFKIGDQAERVNTSIEKNKTTQFRLFPNPTKNEINLNADKNIHTITILNIAGQVVYNTVINATQTSINIQNNPSGIYMLIATLENGDSIRQKFIVQ